MRNKIIILALISCVLFFGCGRGVEEGGDSRTLAAINKYNLTVSDFKNEINLKFAHKKARFKSLDAKEGLLEDMIMRNILIQEAQKQDFDKDKLFMKEIERYWEQALLKLLIKKKTEELSRSLDAEEAERALEAWIDDLRNQAAVKINKRLLEEIDIGQE